MSEDWRWHEDCRKRIAELEAKLKWAMGLNACIEHERAEQAEAENKALQAERDNVPNVIALMKRAKKAEAELAALKGRRCETCLHWRGFTDIGLGVGDCEATKRFCITNQLHTPDTFSCSWWAARAEEGGGE